MIFDWLHSCYTMPARIYSDSDDTVTIRWMRAAPNAAIYPYPNAFGSHVWDDTIATPLNTGIGEQTGAPQIWSPSRVSPWPGTCLPSDSATYLYGISSTATPPPIACCVLNGGNFRGAMAFLGSVGANAYTTGAGALAFRGVIVLSRSLSAAGQLAFGGIPMPFLFIPRQVDFFRVYAGVPINSIPPLIGTSYTIVQGTWDRGNYGLSPTSAGDGDCVTWDDGEGVIWFDVDLTPQFDGSGNRSLPYLTWRFQDANNKLLFLLNQPSNQLQILSITGGVGTLIASTPFTFTSGRTYHISLTDDTFNISITVDGIGVMSVSSADFSGITRKGFVKSQAGTPALQCTIGALLEGYAG